MTGNKIYLFRDLDAANEPLKKLITAKWALNVDSVEENWGKFDQYEKLQYITFHIKC